MYTKFFYFWKIEVKLVIYCEITGTETSYFISRKFCIGHSY